MRKPLVVYHKLSKALDCTDGFGAAFTFWLRYKDDYEYLPGFYNFHHPLDVFKDRKVVFVDFCYDDVAYMDAIYNIAESFLVIDHHRTSILSIGSKPYACLDNSCSGSMLCWRYVFPTAEPPMLIKHISDNDLDLNKLPNTKPFIHKLRSLTTSFEVWQALLGALDDPQYYESFIEDGRIIEHTYTLACRMLAAEAFPITLAGFEGLAVNTAKAYAHDVGRMLSERSATFGATFCVCEDSHVEFSLTSVTPFDVERIARHYGGGGHLSASGFSLPMLDFVALLNDSCSEVFLYMKLKTLVSIFIAEYTAPMYSNKIADTIARDFSLFIANKLGSKVDALNVHVSISLLNTLTFPDRALLFISKMLNLPRSSSTPRWYHKLFPYKIKLPASFDETRISKLLDTVKGSSNYTDAKEIAVASLFQTVNYSYDATLINPSSYQYQLTLGFSDSPFFIQHVHKVF